MLTIARKGASTGQECVTGVMGRRVAGWRQLVVDFRMGQERETQQPGAGEGALMQECDKRGAACKQDEKETVFFQGMWC